MSDYETYRRQLVVNKHHLDDELEVHADILEKIGAQCAALDSRTRRLKDDLDRVEAGVYLDLRDSGQKRIVDEVKALVARHESRRRAFTSYEDSRAEWQRYERLYDAWKTRDFSVRALGKLFGDGYFANEPITGSRHQQREREYEENRARLRDAREAAPAVRVRRSL